MSCHELDHVMTPFVDGECSPAQRAGILAHLQECEGCRNRVQTESSARHLVRTQAAIARQSGGPPAWRPRVIRLGRPLVPGHPVVVLLALAAAAGLTAWLVRPTQVLAAGIVGDSFCQQHHRFAQQFKVGDRECTLGCVRLGAEFVLVTDTQVHRISNQQLPELAAFAGRRVRVTGTLVDGRIRVSRMTPETADR